MTTTPQGRHHVGRTPSSLTATTPKLEDAELLDLPAVSRYERAAALPESSDSSDSSTPDLERGLLMRRLRAHKSKVPSWILKTYSWLSGPSPPVQVQPRQFALENAAEKRLERFARPLRISWLFSALFLVGWLIMMAFLTRESWFTATVEGNTPTLISKTASFWERNDECGLNGEQCQPFNDSSLAFRCPASSNNVKLLNQRAVGPLELNFRKLLVGGGDDEATYRADSWICSAALQQNLISTSYGGCGIARQVGNFSNFQALSKNGLDSVAFDAEFREHICVPLSPNSVF